MAHLIHRQHILYERQRWTTTTTITRIIIKKKKEEKNLHKNLGLFFRPHNAWSVKKYTEQNWSTITTIKERRRRKKKRSRMPFKVPITVKMKCSIIVDTISRKFKWGIFYTTNIQINCNLINLNLLWNHTHRIYFGSNRFDGESCDAEKSWRERAINTNTWYGECQMLLANVNVSASKFARSLRYVRINNQRIKIGTIKNATQFKESVHKFCLRDQIELLRWEMMRNASLLFFCAEDKDFNFKT